jgi:curved DNA-binding protein
MPESLKKQTTYYEILGVLDTATPKDVEKAFRKLVQKWHPDVCADVHRAAANFKLIVEAYEVLGDPEKRRRYDEAEERRRCRHVSVPITRPLAAQWPRYAEVFGVDRSFGMFGGIHSLLESLLRGDWAQPIAPAPQPRPELNVEAELLLTPEEARRGDTVQFKLRFDQTCPECAGRGTTSGALCGTCNGNGRIRQGPRIVTAKISPGVWNGAVIRVQGEGRSPPGTEPPGDLLLRVRVQPCW